MNTERFAILVEKHLAGLLSESETEELTRLLKESGEAADLYLDTVELHLGLGNRPAVKARWRRPRVVRTSTTWPIWASIAAGVTIVFLAISYGTRPAPHREVAQAQEKVESLVREEQKAEEKRNRARQPELRREAEEEFARIVAARKAAEAELEKAKAQERKPEERRPGPTVVVAATLEIVSGKAFVDKSPAKGGEGLLFGQSVETAGESRAVLSYPDKTRLELAGDAKVRLLAEHLSVDRGTLVANVAAPMTFVTPHGEVKVLGTAFTIAVKEMSTSVEVKEGKVRLTRKEDGASVEVGPDHYGFIAKGIPLIAKPLKVSHRFVFVQGQKHPAVTEGKVIVGPDRRVCLESVDSEWGPRVEFKLVPIVQGDPAKLQVRFRYHISNREMVVQLFNETIGDNFKVVPSGAVEGQWGVMTVPLSDFVRPSDSSRIRQGDRLPYLVFFVRSGKGPCYWDEIELVEIE